MEQFFQALHSMKNTPRSLGKIWWKGEITKWFSFEVARNNGTTRMFMRVPKSLVESVSGMLYGNYPEVELFEVADYIDELPAHYDHVAAQGMKFFGAEMISPGSSVYSIRSYKEFESKDGDEKGRINDSFGLVVEFMDSMADQDHFWMQYVVVPHGNEQAYKVLAKKEIEAIRPTYQNEKGRFRFPSDSEKDKIKMIEEKLEKRRFQVTMRYVHMAPQEGYNVNIPYRGGIAIFNHLHNQFHFFGRNEHTSSFVRWWLFPYVFHLRREYWRSVKLYEEYRTRFIPEQTFFGKLYRSKLFRWCFFHKPAILSSEELAGLFHIPTNVVLTAPSMERNESRRLPLALSS